MTQIRSIYTDILKIYKRNHENPFNPLNQCPIIKMYFIEMIQSTRINTYVLKFFKRKISVTPFNPYNLYSIKGL